MRHNVRQRSLSQAAQQFFTLFYRLNRAPLATRSHFSTRSLLASESQRDENRQRVDPVPANAEAEPTQRDTPPPVNGAPEQAEHVHKTSRTLPQKLMTALKHGGHAEPAVEESSVKIRKVYPRTSGDSIAKEQDRKGQQKRQKVREHTELLDHHNGGQKGISPQNSGKAGTSHSQVDAAMNAKALRVSTLNALQERLGKLLGNQISPQAVKSESHPSSPPETAMNDKRALSDRAEVTGSAKVTFHSTGQSKLDDVEAAAGDKKQGVPPKPLRHKQLENIATRSKAVSILRHMPNSVVVVTALDTVAEGHSQDMSAARAMTASSFTSVSMKDDPIVSFNVKQPSRTLQALESRKEFVVHILKNSRKGASIAHAFATGDAEAGFLRITGDSLNAKVDIEPRVVIHHPAIRATLHCELSQPPLSIQDHAVVFGRVRDVIVPPSGIGHTLEEPYRPFIGLMYQDKAYRWVGKPLFNPAAQGTDT